MRNLWLPLIMFLIMLSIAGCKVAMDGLVTADNYRIQNVNGLLLNITQPQDESIVRSNLVTVSGSITHGSEVMVNGLSVSTDNSHFTAMVELEQGPNLIEVFAKDSSGRQASKYITIVYVP